MKEYLLEAGFTRVLTLDPAMLDGAFEDKTLYLCLWTYAPQALPEAAIAAIHPYYPASQRAYQAAREAVAAGAARGLHLRQDTELRLKPIFARLAGFQTGRNTLAYVQGLGSRFHVQALWQREGAEHYDTCLLPEPQACSCGDCHACELACPSGAIAADGFIRERCLRHWMMSGQPIPEAMRTLMGNRLLGCDVCQQVCPRNGALSAQPGAGVPLAELLQAPRECAAALRQEIGANLAIANRVLGQGLLAAGNSGDVRLIPLIQPFCEHPSPLVQEHARWALSQLRP